MFNMKPTKTISHPQKSRGPPVRKTHISKKSRRSPHKMRSSRSPRTRSTSPSLKRQPSRKPSRSPPRSILPSPNRALHQSRHDSPGSLDRNENIKHLKYEKKKPLSPPLSQRLPTREIPSRQSSSMSFNSSNQYVSPKKSTHISRYDSNTKKKDLREQRQYRHSSSQSSSPRNNDSARSRSRSRSSQDIDRMPSPMHSLTLARRRSHAVQQMHEEPDNDSFTPKKRPDTRYSVSPILTSNRPKATTIVKSNYNPESPERYRSESPKDRYASDKDRYPLTLSERFSAVADSNRVAEPRVRYTREDLEKITIDIRRNLRNHSPTLRRIVNPAEVKLVHRANAGHRPIFDREEIKQAPKDMREDAFVESKYLSDGQMSSAAAASSSYILSTRELENYEITRHRFDVYHSSFSTTSSRPLSDRWQNSLEAKDATNINRNDQDRAYDRSQREIDNPRAKPSDRDFRTEKYAGGSTLSAKSDFRDYQRHSYSPPRHNLGTHRKDSIDSQRKIMKGRDTERSHSPSSSRYFHSRSEKHFHDSSDRDKHNSDRRSYENAHKWKSRSRSRSQDSHRKLPDFSRRPDKYNYKPWLDKPSATPKSSSYYEHDNRERSESYRSSRGSSSRPYRSYRGFRSRGRGRSITRGSIRSRGSYRGYRGSTSSRGRPAPRRGRYSPSHWKHDMYSRSSQDRKSDSHAP